MDHPNDYASSNRPELVLTTTAATVVPSPASASLAIIGLASLSLRRKPLV